MVPERRVAANEEMTREQLLDALEQVGARVAELERLVVDQDSMKAALRESEERWRFALEGSNDGLWDWNVQTNEVFFSKRWKEMLGFEEDEIQSQLDEWAKRTHPDDVGWVTEELQRHFIGETPVYVTEHRVKCKDGTYKWILDRGKVMSWTHEGKPLRMVGTHTDITERKKTEETLRQSELNFTTFFNTIPDLLSVVDMNGNIIMVNNTVTERLGYAREEVVGQNVLMLHPASRHVEAGEIIQAMARGEASHCPIPLLTKDGKQIPAETKVIRGKWNNQDVMFGVSKDISELKLSEEKFSKVFHTNAALMALTALDDGRFIDVNEALLTTLGFSREEVIGKTSLELGIFADTAQRDHIRKEVIEKGRARNVEANVRAKNGNIHCGLISADPIVVQKTSYLLTTMNDITKRKHLEDSLKEHALFLQTLIDTIPTPVFWKDTRGRYLGCNEAFATFHGITRDKVLGASVGDVTSRDEADKHQKEDMDLIKNRGSVEYEVIVRNADGEARDVILSKGVFAKVDGTIGGIVGVAVDITERNQTEIKLQESEERYRTVIEHSTDGVAMARGDEWIYVNQRVADILGFRCPEEILERPITACVSSECRAQVAEIGRRRQAGEPVPSGYEIKALRKDGTTVDIEVSATTTIYRGETVSLAYLRDITDRRQAEKDRLHREALQGALDMAGTICHELNQPIQIISGYADLLLMGTLEELKVREKLGIMKEQTRRMGVITKRLMSLKEYTTRDYLGIGRIIDTDKPSEEADHV